MYALFLHSIFFIFIVVILICAVRPYSEKRFIFAHHGTRAMGQRKLRGSPLSIWVTRLASRAYAQVFIGRLCVSKLFGMAKQ